MTADDDHVSPKSRFQNAQAFLVRNPLCAVGVRPTLEQTECRRHRGWRLYLTVKIIAVASVQSPFLTLAQCHPAMFRSMTVQRNDQDVGIRIAKCANSGKPKPVVATFAIELPVRTMLPLLTNIAPGFNEELVRYCCLMLAQVHVDLCVRKIA